MKWTQYIINRNMKHCTHI